MRPVDVVIAFVVVVDVVVAKLVGMAICYIFSNIRLTLIKFWVKLCEKATTVVDNILI